MTFSGDSYNYDIHDYSKIVNYTPVDSPVQVDSIDHPVQEVDRHIQVAAQDSRPEVGNLLAEDIRPVVRHMVGSSW